MSSELVLPGGKQPPAPADTRSLVDESLVAELSWGQLLPPSMLQARLLGVGGRLRNTFEECDIGARDDLEAASSYLRHVAVNATQATVTAYRREISRFLRWCWENQKVALSDVYVEDLTAYQAFLRDPQPRELWVMSPEGSELPARRRGSTRLRERMTGIRRDSDRWRPFVRGMTDANIAYSMGAVARLYGWLVDVGYLTRNPAKVAIKPASRAKTGTRHAIPAELIREVIRTIDGWPADSLSAARRRERARYLIVLMTTVGMRVSDFVNNTMNSFRFNAKAGIWEWSGQRKGARRKKESVDEGKLSLVCPPFAIDAANRYRESMGVAAPLGEDDGFPMASATSTIRPLKYKAIYLDVRQAMEETYRRLILEGRPKQEIACLNDASCHWLRHTFVTEVATAASIDIAQEMAGHADIRTTADYRTRDPAEKSAVADKVARAVFGGAP